MTRVLVVLLGAGLVGCAHGPLMTGNSANSSAQSGNSSGQSGQTSQGSANSSASSNASSQGSANSSAASGQSSVASQASAQSSANSNQSSVQSSQSSQGSAQSTQASNQSSGNSSGATSGGAASSVIVAGSALLSSVAGGIILTVYASRGRAQPQTLQQLQPQSHQPVQPIPGPPPPEVLAPPTHPQPFEPAPYPQPEGIEPEPYPQPMEPVPYPRRTTSSWEPPLDAMVLARAWLQANELQLKQDLALGAGPTLEDLAGIAQIAPQRRAHFYRVLQRHHRELVPPSELTLVEAAEVMSRVGELVLADPVLRVDGEAVALAP